MNHSTRTRYAGSLLALAATLVCTTLVGPVGLELLAYPLPESLLNQLRGLELVTVGLVVPALCVASALALRGRAEAALVAIGPCAYASYMFVQYVVGPARTSYSAAVLLHLVVFVAATVLAVWSWTLAVSRVWPTPDPRRRRRWATLLLALAAFVTLRYLPLLSGAFSGARIPDEFAEAPAFYWSIVLLDLGLVVPATLAAGVAVLRGSRLAVPATYAVVGWFALVPPSVAAMALVMLVRDDPYASLPTTVLMLATSIVTTTAALGMFRRLLGRPGAAGPPHVGRPGRGHDPDDAERAAAT